MNFDKIISDNARDIAPSPIRKFFDIVKTMDGAISLGIGEPDFVTPWHIRDAAVSSINNGETSYTGNAGTPELRDAICRYLSMRFSLKYEPSQIIVTVGASEAIDLAMRALINPGDEVIIPDPSYISYMPNVRLVYGKAVPLPTFAQ
ncbi:MAG: aminotransferase class I/II-fold pyridoxal phosphate-dependent enzyme, partial [Firmicutes bacterium]|nr:aminotransferase class I/II-fold pyridoxal phosphate-dependent enzyme [Bacillota bacterium]